jgi:hypothetical protein
MNKEVKGMEDYVAADDRPLDKCLEDVEKCDVYVGIFAFRYGFIPDNDNSERLSITELEYRHAAKNKKPCLIFLVDNDALWNRKFQDEVTLEADAGKRIHALRDELSKEKLVSIFKSQEELVSAVSAAVNNLEAKQWHAPPVETVKTGPEKRQILFNLFIGYSQTDQAAVDALCKDVSSDPGGLTSLLSARALFSRTSSDFLDLDRNVQNCDIAAAALSSTTFSQMEGDPVYAAEALNIMRSRTGWLAALCLNSDGVARAQKWNFDEIIDLSGYPSSIALIQSLKEALGKRRTVSAVPIIGVPLVVAAMTKSEATDLCNNPDVIGEQLGTAAQKRFAAIRDALVGDLAARYGAARDEWRSPDSNLSVGKLAVEVIQTLASAKLSRLYGRAIKLQRYPFEALITGPAELREVYREMADAGCVLVVDELSLFHPVVRQAVASSPMVLSRSAAILTVSPFASFAQEPAQILRNELKGQLRAVFDRFALDFDPQCELNVGDECRLRRWLHQSLPETLKMLRTPRAVPEQLAIFAQELKVDPDPRMGALIYSRGGGL